MMMLMMMVEFLQSKISEGGGNLLYEKKIVEVVIYHVIEDLLGTSFVLARY